MKKTIKGLLFALMAVVSFSVMAENTVEFYFDNFAIKAGEKKQIELKMKNNFLGRDFQVQVFFPEGITPVPTRTGGTVYFQKTGRAVDEDGSNTFSQLYVAELNRIRLMSNNMLGTESTYEAGDGAVAKINVQASVDFADKVKLVVKAADGFENKLNYETETSVATVTMQGDKEAGVYPAVTLPWLIANGTDGAEYGIADPVAVLFETTLGAFVQDAAHTPMRVVADKEWGVLGCAAETMMGVYSVENGNPCLTTFKGMPTPKEDSSIEPAVKQTTLNNVLFAPEANEVVTFGGYMRSSDNAVCAYPGPGDQGQCITLNWSALMARAGVPTDGSYFRLVGPVLQKMVWEEAEETQGMTGKDGPGAWKNYVVYPVEINTDVPTGVNDVNAKTVAGVKYVNAAGVESNTPFDGINIVVTSYTDGTMSAVKVVK